MPNVRYYLKDKNKSNTLILLFFKYKNKRLVISTEQKINPGFWDYKKQRAKKLKAFPSYMDINAALNDLEKKTESAYNSFLLSGIIPDPAQLKSEIKSNFAPAPKAQLTLFQFIESFITEREQNPKFTKGTIKNYRKYYRILKTYAEVKNKMLSFDNLDKTFFSDYQNYLFVEKQLSNNYARKIINSIKIFLNEAGEKGIKVNPAYKSRRVNLPIDPVENIYLTVAELKKLYSLDLSRFPKLDKIRDKFLIGAFTGLRFSDFSQLERANFRQRSGAWFIKIESKKTGTPLTIPVHPIVLSIMEKYNWMLMVPISNQKFNDYLKDVCLIAGFVQDVKIYFSAGGTRQSKTVKKFRLIKTHTARRSFATNALIAGISETLIMQILGIKKRETLAKYIKISNEETALLLSQNDFFK